MLIVPAPASFIISTSKLPRPETLDAVPPSSALNYATCRAAVSNRQLADLRLLNYASRHEIPRSVDLNCQADCRPHEDGARAIKNGFSPK